MKKLVLVILVALLASCQSVTKLKEYEDFEDNYVDALPDNAEDGLTLHAFNWTYKQVKDNLEAIKDAGFKNVLLMPVQQPKSFGSAWWAFYQPLSFSIGDKSPLGSKDDLIDLCKEAEKLNICILVDAVVNHMANAGDKAIEEDGTPMVDVSVSEYEPILYNNRNEDLDGHGITFHHNKNARGTGEETQHYQYGNLPDLNTSNPYVQERVLNLLKECIDVGVDGFRFDAAKHVETDKDPDYASDFWNNTVGEAKKYYKDKTGKNLYVYGEILGLPKARSLDLYTNMMLVTDDGFVAQYKNCMAQKNAELILNAKTKVEDPRKLIAWVESHDEYISGNTHYSDPRIAKYWSVIAAKSGLGGLYLARPSDSLTVGEIGSYAFEKERVAISNRFHNRFYNAQSYESAEGVFYVNEKILENDQGALIINVGEIVDNQVVVNTPHLEDGNYYDNLTGKKVVVENGKAYIHFDDNGVCIITRTNKVHPDFDISDKGGSFIKEKNITIDVRNYDDAYVYFNDNKNDKIDINDSIEINLNEKLINDVVKVNLYIKGGNNIIERTFTFNKLEIIDGKFNVLNLDPKYYTDYELYIWSWSPSKWSKDYEIVDGIMLVDTSGMDGFLLGIFEKDYVIKDSKNWDSKVIIQSFDIANDLLKQGYVDMSGF